MATRARKVSAAKKACQKRAKHRAAQKKYVAKSPAAQRKRVQKSQQKPGAAKKKKTAGTGKHGSKVGRPQKACNLAVPEYASDIDLTGDGHGHHVPGTPMVYSHGWKPVGAKAAPKPSAVRFRSAATKHHPHLTLVEGKGKGRSTAMGKDDPSLHRHLLNLANETRTEIFKENGLTLTHPEVPEHELLERIQSERDPKIRAELIADAKRRADVLKLTLAAVARADIDAKREKTRERMSKFDERLRQIKGGRAILSLRDRILHDKMLDRLGFLRVKGGSLGKDIALRVATATALGMVFGPIGVAAGVAGGAAVSELVHSILEQSVVHAVAEHFVEKHLVERVYETALKGAKAGGKAARNARKVKRAKAVLAAQAAKAV